MDLGAASLFAGGLNSAMNYWTQDNANRSNREMAERANRLSYLMSQENRIFSANQAAREMAWQERMSNTAWQRGVADMKKAGINPLLAFSQGGASTPSGAMGSGSSGGVTTGHSQQPVGNLVSSALGAMNSIADIRTKQTQADFNVSSARSADASAARSLAEARKTVASTPEKEIEADVYKDLDKFYRRGRDAFINAFSSSDPNSGYSASTSFPFIKHEGSYSKSGNLLGVSYGKGS